MGIELLAFVPVAIASFVLWELVHTTSITWFFCLYSSSAASCILTSFAAQQGLPLQWTLFHEYSSDRSHSFLTIDFLFAQHHLNRSMKHPRPSPVYPRLFHIRRATFHATDCWTSFSSSSVQAHLFLHVQAPLHFFVLVALQSASVPPSTTCYEVKQCLGGFSNTTFAIFNGVFRISP